MRSVEVVSHTADVGLRVTAGSLAELFAGATEGMLSLMWSCPPVPAPVERAVTVPGGDLVELLWGWLSAVLAWAEVDDACYRDVVVHIGDGEVSGTLRGVPVADCAVVGPAVKAVTLHGLEVEETDGTWTATVVFDV